VSVEDPTIHSKDKTATVPGDQGFDLAGRLWTHDDFMSLEAMPVNFSTGLVSLAFIRAAIRRGARFLCAMAIAGLLIGLGVYGASPPAYQASTSVLLAYGPYENPNTAPQDNQAIGQSRAVAGLALHQLGLRESVTSFLAAYTFAPVSSRVLLITVSAPSSNDAVSRAKAVARAFLQYRARELETQQNLVLRSLDQQISQAKQTVNSFSSQIRQVSAQAATPAEQAKLSSLQADHSQAASALATLEQSAKANPDSPATALAVKGSVVLDAATPLPHSRLKPPLFDATIGLVLGLALGLGIIVVRTLGSDRLCRRDDVAAAIGASVRCSVGAVRLGRWRPGARGLEAARSANVEQVTAHLDRAVPRGAAGAAALAVVPADDPRVAALALTSLALSRARQGLRIAVADLYPGAPAAHLLQVTEPGVHRPRVPDVEQAELVVVVPEPEDVAPGGPFSRSSHAEREPGAESLASACARADLVLTLAAVDPSIGGDYLRGWARTVVAVVTAGQSSATRIHAVGELIRLAGLTLDSAVLVGADKRDESLGVSHSPHSGYRAGQV
jgi:capsular polysaccharide biosynthesis protein